MSVKPGSAFIKHSNGGCLSNAPPALRAPECVPINRPPRAWIRQTRRTAVTDPASEAAGSFDTGVSLDRF
eukprot:6692163-Prymnesium_polylepis.1